MVRATSIVLKALVKGGIRDSGRSCQLQHADLPVCVVWVTGGLVAVETFLLPDRLNAVCLDRGGLHLGAHQILFSDRFFTNTPKKIRTKGSLSSLYPGSPV